MKPRFLYLCIGLAAARLCSTQILQWQPSRKSSGIGWYPYLQTGSTGYTAPRRTAFTHGQMIAHPSASVLTKNITSQALVTNPIPRSRLNANTEALDGGNALFSDMISDSSRAVNPVTTTELGSTLQNMSVTKTSSVLFTPVTATNQDIATSSDGAPLAGLLRQITNNGKSLSAKITIAASKAEFIQSIKSTEPSFQKMFDDLGGTDIPTGGCHHPGGGILNSIVNLVGCAIKTLKTLKAKVDIPDGVEPDFPSINQDLEDIGDISGQLTNRGGEVENPNKPSGSRRFDQSSVSRDLATSLSSNLLSTMSSSPLSSIASTTSSLTSSTISEILGYRTPIMGRPELDAIPATVSEHFLEIVGSALVSAFYTTNSSNSLLLTMEYSRSNFQTSEGPRKASSMTAWNIGHVPETMLPSTTTYLETSTPTFASSVIPTSASNTIISRSVDTSYANEPRQTRTSQALSSSIAASSRTTSLVCSRNGSATVRPSAASSNIERFCGQQDHLVQISPTASTSQSFPELEWNNTVSVGWVPGCKSVDSAYTLTWDVCTFYLYHIINACGGDSNDVYGGSLTASVYCMVFALAPQPYINPQPSINDQKVVCGAFDNGGGMGHRTFSTANAYDAIDKFCNGVEKYSSDPKDKSAVYGVEIIGNAHDRFWYRGSAYCETTSPHDPVPGLPRGDSTACGGSMDYEIDVRVIFNEVQTGCQPKQYYPVPKGKECSDTLGKVISSCKYSPE